MMDSISEDDADLICRAVNAFDDMVSAIKEARNTLEKATGQVDYPDLYDQMCNTADKLSDLLQKIEEKEEVTHE